MPVEMTTRAAREDGGDQVGEGLAGAGAGLDDEVLAFGERGLDRQGHFELAGAELEVGVPLGEGAVGGEEVAGGDGLGASGHRRRQI